jgi:cytochrome c-type biogenesis protein CcmH
MKPLMAVLTALALVSGALAKEAVPLAEDPAVEQRMVKITEELRCLVCQNESLAGSQADLAKDLREEVRGLIRAGKSDEEVKEFLVSRYGDFVLYRPQVKPVTYLLWGGPFLLLILGIIALVRYLRRRNRQLPDTPLSAEERARIEALLKDHRP